ncbi:MAG: hypothetical protein ACHQU1_01285 [Gemmatimonadales bacterium]
MARTYAWRRAAFATLVVATAFACTEKVMAPGRCPDLCPADSLQIVDTVITGVVFGDTSVRGYTRVDQAPILVVANQDSFKAHALIRFAAMPKLWIDSVGDSISFGGVDSVVLLMRLAARDTAAKNLRVLVYRVPGDTLDSTTTYTSSLPWFTGGHFLDSVPVADTLVVADLHRCWKAVADTSCADFSQISSLIPDTVKADTLFPGLGLDVRADSQTVAVVSATDFTAVPAHLKFYVHGAAPLDSAHTVFDLTPLFDTYVQTPDPPVIAPQTLVMGNQPAARAFVRFQIPAYYIDTVGVSRATLLLTPSRAARGFPHATFGLEALPILRFFGGKSLLIQDTTLIGKGTVTVGSAAVVSIEIGNILRVWKGTSPDSLPRALSIRVANELFETGQLDAFGSAGGANAPRLEISFVRPLKFGVP